MVVLQVTGMSCGGCVSKITRAIQALDQQARIEADLATGRVVVETSENAASLRELVQRLGFGAEIGA
ncbi:heavy metal transporter [Pseudomonas fluvialis]|uniref:Copper chaperone n=1 Tax=Pseudomonas fluvialis TaxID=1793966 RepID=A0ABQ2AM99_9PSED|nr:heavy-metal-associated domain-containing protein [Pseudomonas fluvialis]OXM39518.1 heavy metal transporter [Pseudomonas fluvialis]GGH92261.1 copper chaperone [Pseudomonas fluvialis]